MKNRILGFGAVLVLIAAGILFSWNKIEKNNLVFNPEKRDEIQDSDDTPETLTILCNDISFNAGYDAVSRLAEEKLGIRIEFDYMTSMGNEGNIIRTRLACGEMADICIYNSGSLLTELNPEEYFVDLSKMGFVSKLEDTFLEAVTVNQAVYGVPDGYYNGTGAVLYNKKVYEEYGLEIPHTWNDFIDNCKVLKAAGKDAVIGTFAQDWCSQVVFLADYYNVQRIIPDFARQFVAGEIKYAEIPATLRSFEKCIEVVPYYNSNYVSENYQDGCDRLLEGEGAHYIAITGTALSYMYESAPDKVNDIGMFGLPGEDENDHGVTLWPANALYVNKNSRHLETALRFLEFYMSDEAIAEYMKSVPPSGPLAVKGITLPEDAMQAVKDGQAYIKDGQACTALEYQTAFKGENCDQLTRKLGLGQITAKESAEAYDLACERQAVLLGLEWQ